MTTALESGSVGQIIGKQDTKIGVVASFADKRKYPKNLAPVDGGQHAKIIEATNGTIVSKINIGSLTCITSDNLAKPRTVTRPIAELAMGIKLT